MFNLSLKTLDCLKALIMPVPELVLPGPTLLAACANCSGTCTNTCKGTCKGSCKGGCTRSCKGSSR